MSIPRNHHFVSRVLSNKFMSAENYLFKYNKTTTRVTSLSSTKSLFSQKDLNSAIGEDGSIDYTSVEETLNRHFEKDFPKYYQVIVDTINANHEIGKEIPNSDQLTAAIEGIIHLGLIGRSRHPLNMLENEAFIFGSLLNITQHSTYEVRNNILSHYQSLQGIKNKLPIDYNELSQGMVKLMGKATYSIMIAPENYYFLLPDCTAASQRFKLQDDDVIDGQVFINPAMPIGLVLMPINSKLLVAATASKLVNNHGHGTYQLNSEVMHSYNKILFEQAYEEVVCENNGYLNGFLELI